jgi:predicted dehydrogenase
MLFRAGSSARVRAKLPILVNRRMRNSDITRIIVIGAGSIGERHIRAFSRIEGVSVSFVEPKEVRAREIADRYECAKWFTDFDAVPLESFDAAVIATPADSHVSIGILSAQAGLHLLIEKPLSVNVADIDRLIALSEQKKLTASVGYTLRFHPTVAKLRDLVNAGTIGDPISVHSACTHYLPDSRPDYRQAYYGTVNAAAGVILDLSHELNYLEWIFGGLRLDASRRALAPELAIAEEAIADLWLSSRNGLMAAIHLHAADRSVRRECHIAGSEATLAANLLTGEILVTGGANRRYEEVHERDTWHIDQARDFLDAIQKSRPPRCTLREALATLSVCLDAMRSPMQKITTADSTKATPGNTAIA